MAETLRPAAGGGEADRAAAATSGDRGATYREVFGVAEFRALFAAQVLSLLGDQLAKVAAAVLVYSQTRSPLLSAVAFGISYLPWIVGGPLLASVADRIPRRRVLVGCDLARAGLVALLALPGLPLAALLGLLFAAALFSPPFESARSATIPEVLTGDRYVLGNGIGNIANQAAQVLGYAAGGLAVAGVTPRGALLLDALTFLVSAALIRARLQPRALPPADGPASAWQEMTAGLRLVFGSRVLLAYVTLAWIPAMFVYGPDGIMVPYAGHLGGGAPLAGLLLAANPLGVVVGSLWFSRAVRPGRRITMVRPMAVATSAALVPILFDPPLPVVLALFFISGALQAYNLPLNALFVQAVPPRYRGRAFGVAASGLFLTQGAGVFLAGAAADRFAIPAVIGVAGAVGVLGVLPALVGWPSAEQRAVPVAAPAAPAARSAGGGRHRA